MFKNIPYFLAVSLLTFSYTNTAEAGRFSKCTAALGKKGGEAAYKCVKDSDPSSDPHFFDSFTEIHCSGKIKPADKSSCKLAEQKMEDQEDQEEDDE